MKRDGRSGRSPLEGTNRGGPDERLEAARRRRLLLLRRKRNRSLSPLCGGGTPRSAEVKATLGLGALLIKRGAVDEALPWLEHSVAHARTPTRRPTPIAPLPSQLLGRNWQAAISSYEAGAALAPSANSFSTNWPNCFSTARIGPCGTRRGPSSWRSGSKRGETHRKQRRTRAFSALSRGRGSRTVVTTEARETAVAGLDAVAALLRQDPLPKPWTREELASLEKWFRENSAKPAR